MLRSLLITITVILAAAPLLAQDQTNTPQGEILSFTFNSSKIFPGTTRDVSVYVPAQYKPETPACLYVNQDGVQFNAPAVFDELIHNKEMPVTIGVFVTPGIVPAQDSETALARYNRSYEYDGLGDNYARFLIEELLPAVESKTTSDGRKIHLSDDPNDRAIGGTSSGAVCAFTVAWQRPDSFRRVFSGIGTYVGLRGADRYPTLIRKYKPKPIRIFLQDGSNDLNIYGGDWWMANQTMQRALEFAGYDVKHVWGEGGHSNKHATELFPDAMRWLWRDHPQPIEAGDSKNSFLQEILIEGKDWELVGEGYRFTEGPVANHEGIVFFNDIPNEKTYRIDEDGNIHEFIAASNRANGQAFGPDGRHYAAAAGTGAVVVYDENGEATTVADGIPNCNDLVVAHNGNIYVTAPNRENQRQSKVWLIRPDGEKIVVDEGLNNPNGVALSPDQSLLYVAESRSHWVTSFVIAEDGTLTHQQRYYWLHSPDTRDEAGADGMAVDAKGRLYVATHLGLQICDQAGRVHAILPLPAGRPSNVCFGGEQFDILYVTSGDKVYRRKINIRGVNPWEPPHTPEKPRL